MRSFLGADSSLEMTKNGTIAILAGRAVNIQELARVGGVDRLRIVGSDQTSVVEQNTEVSVGTTAASIVGSGCLFSAVLLLFI